MSPIIVCKNCHEAVEKNPRLKTRQEYCGKKLCQQARKTRWAEEKYKKYKSYRQKKSQYNKQWRKRHRADEYQRNYRAQNSKYASSNRESQKERNKNRKDTSKKISTGAIISNNKNTQEGISTKDCKARRVSSKSPISKGLYAIFPYNPDAKQKIVKQDALLIQLANIEELRAENLFDSS